MLTQQAESKDYFETLKHSENTHKHSSLVREGVGCAARQKKEAIQSRVYILFTGIIYICARYISHAV